MVKGFIFFKEGKIPFVIENYKMELFSDNDILEDFYKQYNFKQNYILNGQCYYSGNEPQNSTFLVNYSMGTTCFLYCYMSAMIASKDKYDSIGFQSPYLDDVFRYKYNYIDMARNNTNLSAEQIEIYKIPFSMNQREYELSYRIGQSNRMGLWEDFDKKGEIILSLQTNEIRECYALSVVLHRLAMFMTSRKNVQFKQISLYQNGLLEGRFFCPLVSDKVSSMNDMLYFKLDVMKYIPRILNNIARDSGNEITDSIPLGHLIDSNDLFSPKRFIEQIMAFEYLFDKLDSKKAQSSKFPLKKELQCMLERFPSILSLSHESSEVISEKIKELRRRLAHGYSYYYDFDDDLSAKFLMSLMDKLIRNMSLLWIGFSEKEIEDYPILK